MTSMPPPGRPGRSNAPWGYRPPEPAPPPQPAGDSLLRRLKLAVAALSALLIVLVAFAWLHGSDETSLNPIAQAAQLTQGQPGSRIAILGTYTPQPGSQPLTMRGSGVYNGRTGASRQRMTIELPESLQPMQMEALGDRQMVYLRSAQLAAGLPPGNRWLGIQPGLGRSAQTAIAGNADSRDQLEILRATSGGVDTLGEEDVRGTATTRYKGAVELQRVAELFAEERKGGAARQYEQLAKVMPEPIPVEAWIDDTGLMRRVRIGMNLPPDPGAQPIEMNLTLEFFDFGIDPEIELPAAGEVFDSTPLSRADLHLLDGSTWAISSNAAKGPALSAATFRKRASDICNSDTPRQVRMKKAVEPLANRIAQLLRRNQERAEGREKALRALHTYGSSYMEPMIQIGVGELREIARLTPPAQLRTQIQRFLHTGSIALEVSLAQTRALELGAFKTAKELKPQLENATRGAKQAAREAGLKACYEEPDDS